MGKFFPDFRPASKEQTQEYRDSEKDRYRDERHQSKLPRPLRPYDDTQERYNRLNDRVRDTEGPLSRTQQTWHRHRADDAVDREFRDKQRESDRQDRQRRREQRGGGRSR